MLRSHLVCLVFLVLAIGFSVAKRQPCQYKDGPIQMGLENRIGDCERCKPHRYFHPIMKECLPCRGDMTNYKENILSYCAEEKVQFSYKNGIELDNSCINCKQNNINNQHYLDIVNGNSKDENLRINHRQTTPKAASAQAANDGKE